MHSFETSQEQRTVFDEIRVLILHSTFLGLFSQLLKLRFTAMVTYSFHSTVYEDI